ncbi:hypothetical protein DES53_11433 [Roseimicrobium gellanilyticum]|uniref:Uncharacterized protein n=1 Tax=Roseimicrobium gellanilyticum TaxID=748857 RepID=A0A366H719_9BACT|nr:hypothetical protein [Roseimicrobium gellanilyticum]RBP37295.1 hypothetical protein DES53_11433 [Roseimicrobium gellanilyticum]
MKPLSRFRRFVPVLLLPLAISLSQCGKKEDPATPKAADGGTPGSPSAPARTEPAKAASLVDHAAKLGFAAKLPADTELYIGSAQLKKHLENIKKSSWWKDLSALVEDKTPAPAAGEKAQQLALEVWGDDMFIAGGQGFAQDAELLRDLNRLYNEVYFKLILSGSTASLQTDGAAPSNPLAMVQPLLTDQASLEKLGQFISKFQLPSMIAGVKTDKGPEVIAELFSEKSLKNKPAEIEISDLKTPDGHAFKVITIDMSKVITEEKQKEMLEGFAKMLPEPAQKALTKALADVRSKKFVFVVGAVEGYLLLATGKSLDHVKFAADPSKSLLSKPEMAWLLPYAQKDLTGLVYSTAATMSALHDDQPLVPMLRGGVAALKDSEMFKPMGEALEKQIDEMAGLEKNVYAREFTSVAGVSWWEGGALNAEFFGGARNRFMTLGKPLSFAGLVERPGVVFGIAYHRNPEYEKAVRLWIEKLVSIAYTGAQQLVQAGIAGPEGGQQFALFEMMLLPTIKEVYQADRQIDEKGLGSQFAALLDVNGQMPSLPGVTLEDSKKMKFPRLTMVSEVANRGEIASGWATISKTITNFATIATSMMGKGAEGGAPPPIPTPESTEANGMTTWFYKNEIFNGDLYPVSSINDKLLVVSTSKPAAESLTADLAKPAAKVVEGCVWRLDISALADWIADASALSPTQTPEQIKEVRQNLKWVQPFHALQGHIFQEKDQPRVSLKWELSDVVSFD